MSYAEQLARLTKAIKTTSMRFTSVRTDDLIAIIHHFNRVDKELREQEQHFKQKEFKYMTECQNILSIGRIEADAMPDRLAELEKIILNYYLDKGYKIGVGEWGFELEICSNYKSKWVKVTFWDKEEGIREEAYKNMSSISTKDMFDEAMQYFKVIE